MMLRKCVTCVLTDSSHRVALGRRRDPQRWELPGGFVDSGERWHEAAIRESAEELGAVARSLVPRLISIDTDNSLLCVTYAGMLDNPSELVDESTEMSEVHLMGRSEAEQLVAPIYLPRLRMIDTAHLWIQLHAGAKTLSLDPCSDVEFVSSLEG